MTSIAVPPDDTEYEASASVAAAIRAAGIPATNDPRAAQPPVVLVAPLRGDFTTFGCGQAATFELWLLSPSTGNADAWRILAHMFYWLRKAYPHIGQYDFRSYSLSVDNPPFPAYRAELEVSV